MRQRRSLSCWSNLAPQARRVVLNVLRVMASKITQCDLVLPADPDSRESLPSSTVV